MYLGVGSSPINCRRLSERNLTDSLFCPGHTMYVKTPPAGLPEAFLTQINPVSLALFEENHSASEGKKTVLVERQLIPR